MTAYLVLNYDVTDRPALESYRRAAATSLLDDAGGVLLASTAATVSLDEAPSVGSDTVVLSYDDVDAARAAYQSATYQQVVPQRLAATIPRVAMIVPDR